jgi:hypothetical protein
MIREIILLMVGTKISAGCLLILIMAGGMPPVAGSSFSWYTARKIPFMYSFSGNCTASVPISTCHVSVSDLYIPSIGPHISLQQNRQTNPGNI